MDSSPVTQTFQELVDSRRIWIETVLQPWCEQASRRDLRLAEHEWQDLAGRPAPEMTLWLWAWRRFPVLCNSQMHTLNETSAVTVHCSNGTATTGFPDARQSQYGQLVLVGERGQTFGPFSIDDIQSIEMFTE